MAVITSIADLKALYRKRVPRMFYDYCESGSYTEQTFRDNSADFAEIRLRQKVAVDLSDRSTGGRMLGQTVTSANFTDNVLKAPANPIASL